MKKSRLLAAQRKGLDYVYCNPPRNRGQGAVEPGNVVTSCPRCGIEHAVDLVELAQEMKDFDLYGTGVYCLKCSEAMRKNRAVKFPSK